MRKKLKSVLLSFLAFSLVANSGICNIRAMSDNDWVVDSKMCINTDNVLTNNFEGFGIQWDQVICLLIQMNNGLHLLKKPNS